MNQGRPKRPNWTVCYNIATQNWVGTAWEFFDTEASAKICYDQQIEQGNCPSMRPFYITDITHLGAVHQTAELLTELKSFLALMTRNK